MDCSKTGGDGLNENDHIVSETGALHGLIPTVWPNAPDKSHLQ